MGLRAAPPAVPECWSLAAVSRRRRNVWRPRSPAGEAAKALAGLSLSERDRQIVQLRFFEGLTQSEIAERINISQMHVSRLLARALSTLRGEFEGA